MNKDPEKMSREELREAVFHLIAKELGPIALVRFVQDHYQGSGDYTAERDKALPNKPAYQIAEDVAKWVREGRPHQT